MAKFVRVGARGINVEQIVYYEMSGTLGAGLGRGAAPTGQAVALVVHFVGEARLTITDPNEARELLEAINRP
jgi:putative flippase GtrA